MDLIRNYIEALFSTLPKTREVVDMKCGLLEHLEETYERYRGEGKSEAEAAGLALGGIGTAAEIRSELGLSEAMKAAGPEADRRDAKFDAMSGALWVATTVIYLVLGFVYGYWHPGWLVFLVAVVLQIGIDYMSKSKSHSDARR